MSRIEKINELLKRELSNLINRNIPIEEGLITITYAKCSPDLRYAKIAVSIMPENLYGSALKRLRQNSSAFSNELKKKLNLKFIPKFNWVIDKQEKHASEIEEILAQIKSE